MDTFVDVIRSGNLQQAKELYNTVIMNNDAYIDYEKLFFESCANGHLTTAQWLLSVKPDINISAENEMAFRGACFRGHLPVSQWLLSVKPDINISAENEMAFRLACINGHLHVAQWLLSVKPDIDISTEDEEAFRCSCSDGHLQIAQWLLSVKPDIPISAMNDYAFLSCCFHGHLQVAQWLMSLNENYTFVTENNKIIRYHVSNRLKIDGTITIDRKTITEENEICPICYNKEVEIQTNCKHNYCKSCIETVTNTKNICPYCRTNLSGFYKIV